MPRCRRDSRAGVGRAAISALLSLLSSCAANTGSLEQKVFRELPGLEVYLGERKVVAEGVALRPEMPLEVLICAPGGKEYECALLAKCKPSHLHQALILIGLKNGRPGYFDQATQQYVLPAGDGVDISVEWEEKGERKLVRAEKFARVIKTRTPMETVSWVFVGSHFTKDPHDETREAYAGDLTGNLVTTYHDPTSVLDNPLPTGSDDNAYELNDEVAPPQGTSLRIVFRPKL